MGALRTLGHSATFVEMTEFLASCEEAVPTELFNRLSNKRRIDLWSELRGREVTLYQHADTGVAVREAKSSKGIIRNPAEARFLCEVSRTYRNGKTVLNYSNAKGEISIEYWSISETMRLGEWPIECLLRGIEEELGVKRQKMDLKKIEDTFHISKNFHKSSAYAGVYSDTTCYWHNVETYQLSRDLKPYNVRDNGVKINREWWDENLPAAT